uniref:Uncharacterized protein n=1 Tax=uncultured bacterium Contig3a TaxID=1393567 RepID=W0FGF1_9BACT|nr:hypothetical protein [uncultured bacterium Contig3a]
MMMAMTTMSNNTVKMMGLEGSRRNARRSSISNLMAKIGAFLRSRLQASSETRWNHTRNESEELLHQARCMSWAANSALTCRRTF